MPLQVQHLEANHDGIDIFNSQVDINEHSLVKLALTQSLTHIYLWAWIFPNQIPNANIGNPWKTTGKVILRRDGEVVGELIVTGGFESGWPATFEKTRIFQPQGGQQPSLFFRDQDGTGLATASYEVGNYYFRGHVDEMELISTQLRNNVGVGLRFIGGLRVLQHG